MLGKCNIYYIALKVHDTILTAYTNSAPYGIGGTERLDKVKGKKAVFAISSFQDSLYLI